MNPASVSALPASAAVPLTLPTRRELRVWMDPYAQARIVQPVAALMLDYAGLVALWTATVLARAAVLKILCGALAGYWIARLFILGHALPGQTGWRKGRGHHRLMDPSGE